MSDIARRSLGLAVVAALVLLVGALALAGVLEARPPSAAHLEALRFDLAVFKTILAGFMVAVLGILIPAAVTQAQQRFEQRRESRAAYSAAKTGIDYLKLELAAAGLSEAVQALHKAHLNKHMAQLYEEFPGWIRLRYGPEMTPDRWDQMMYDRLFDARLVLEAAAKDWDRLDPARRIALLDKALPSERE